MDAAFIITVIHEISLHELIGFYFFRGITRPLATENKVARTCTLLQSLYRIRNAAM
jgi:hypothetical protein